MNKILLITSVIVARNHCANGPLSWAQAVFIPIYLLSASLAPAKANGFTNQQIMALRVVNYYRTLAGEPMARLDPALCEAAQNHAKYSITNYGIRESAHSETRGLPGLYRRSATRTYDCGGIPRTHIWRVYFVWAKIRSGVGRWTRTSAIPSHRISARR
jgi:hypothetical protein